MEADCRVIILVTGRVHGVGFRYSTLQMAKNLQLTGFVKNLPDNQLYIEAQGKPDSVRVLIEWCKRGPDHALVELVESSYHPLADFSQFLIRR